MLSYEVLWLYLNNSEFFNNDMIKVWYIYEMYWLFLMCWKICIKSKTFFHSELLVRKLIKRELMKNYVFSQNVCIYL